MIIRINCNVDVRYESTAYARGGFFYLRGNVVAEKMTDNLFSMIPDSLANEHVSTLLRDKCIVIERIVSAGQTTPPGEWLVQDKNEWVVLIQGTAKLMFKNEEKVRYLQPGDYVHIPANCRHRVEWTDPNRKTVWLAVHYK